MLACLIYGFPGKKLTVIAVAGTKGKTSTAYFVSTLLGALDIHNALFSTAALKMRGAESLNALKLTTPTPFFLQKFLQEAAHKGCTHAVLEVSSHAISQHRIWGIPLHYVCITNLAPDHLEFHSDGKEYQHVHTKLITPRLQALILNADDPHLDLFKSFDVQKTYWSMTSFEAQEVRKQAKQLVGDYTLANALAAFTTTQSLGLPKEKILHALPLLKAAPGRMEKIECGQPFDVIVDYAHSPESLTAFFQSLKPLVKGKIITVFGACGDRDKRQRPVMGSILEQVCDSIIITNDDPYTENPENIANQVLAGIQLTANVLKILDRAEAIKKALSLAQQNDCVCILGKGAEQWQVFKNKKIPWDDRVVVKKLLEKNDALNTKE